jgi:hypothetical protein
MKAGRVSRFGGPEVVEIPDVPTPRPRAGEVLVALRAAGLNRADVLVRAGGVAAAPMPIVLGCEGAGTVAEIGAGVTGLVPATGWSSIPSWPAASARPAWRAGTPSAPTCGSSASTWTALTPSTSRCLRAACCRRRTAWVTRSWRPAPWRT